MKKLQIRLRIEKSHFALLVIQLIDFNFWNFGIVDILLFHILWWEINLWINVNPD